MIELIGKEELAVLPTLILPEGFRQEAVSRETEAAACHRCEAYRPIPQLSGNLQVDPEILLPSVGMNVDINYYYNASSTQNGPFGYGRTLSSNMQAQASGSPVIVTLTRGNGSMVSYQDDGSGRFVSKTPGQLNSLVKDVTNSYWKENTLDGFTTAYPLNTTGQISSVTYVQDAVSNTHTFAYSSGLLQTVQDMAGRLVTFGYSSGLLQSIQDWAGRRTTFQYDTASASPKSLLTTITGPTGCQTQYQYGTFAVYSGTTLTSDWLLRGIIDPNGYGTSYTYDRQKRVVTRTVAGVGVTTYLYQPGSMTTVDALGVQTTQTFDANFALLSSRNALGAITTYTRNASLQEISRQNPLGVVWSTSYDGNGNVSGTIDPLGNRVTLTHDSFNNVTGVQTMDGAIVTNVWGYGGSGFDTTGTKRRLQAVINQLGNITSYTYTGLGLMTSVQDAMGNFTSYTYNGIGNRVSMTDPIGNVWSSIFDLVGNVTASITPLGNTWTTIFDNQNRPLTSIDPLGNVNTVAYDSVGNKTVEVSSLGYRTSYAYNVFDKQASMQDAQGNVWTNLFDATGNRIARIGPSGAHWTNTYDMIGRPMASMDPFGYRTTTLYDAASSPVAVVDPQGNFSTTIYDSIGRIVSTVDPLGAQSTHVFNSVGREIMGIDPLGRILTSLFDSGGNVTAGIDASACYTSYAHDSRGKISTYQNMYGDISSYIYDATGRSIAFSSPSGIILTRVYDRNGNHSATVDALGNRNTNYYDAADRLLSTQDALGRIRTNIYDAGGRLLSDIDPMGSRTTYSYTPTGQIANVQNALGAISTMQYNSMDQVLCTIDALGYRTSFNYDLVGRQISIQTSAGSISTQIFDSKSQLVGHLSPLGIYITQIYDGAGRQIAFQNGLGQISTTVYNQAGYAIASIDPLGYRQSSIYDSFGRRTASIDALGNRASTIFNMTGKVLAIQNANGFLTSFLNTSQTVTAYIDASGRLTTQIYDPLGRLLSVQDPLGFYTSYLYDAVGNKIQQINPSNQVTTFVMDLLDRTSRILYADGSRVTYFYSIDPQPTMISEAIGITTLSYDSLSRLVSVLAPNVRPLTYGYDNVGNRTLLIDTDGGYTTYTYDKENRLLSLINPFAETTTCLYDILGREQRRTFGNGMVVSHTYDAIGHEIVLKYQFASGVVPAVYTMQYDGVGLITRVQEIDGSIYTYVYDATHQLLSEQGSGQSVYITTYTYDPAGNRLTKADGSSLTTYSYNPANALTRIQPTAGQPTTNTFDPRGNLTSGNVGGVLTSYSWDTQNRLVAVNTGSSIETYTYSVDNLRKIKVSPSGTVNYMYDFGNLLQEKDATYATQVGYTYAPGSAMGLLSQRRSGTSSFYGFDGQSNTRILASGNSIANSYTYKAFGEELSAVETISNNYRYGGNFGYYRDAANRHNVRRRHLDTAAGRWLSRDPIGLGGRDFNLYRYVDNQPVTGKDPSGTYVVLVPGGKGHPNNFFALQTRILSSNSTEEVIRPIYQWGNLFPNITAPEAAQVMDVLQQINDWIERSSVPGHPRVSCGIRMYGHSYGGHVVGQIASPQDSGVKSLKQRIEDYCCRFIWYVSAVSNAADYPKQFKKINVNLYTLKGDRQLSNPLLEDRDWDDGPAAWFTPENYNTRGKEFIPDMFPQSYMTEGEKDKIIQAYNSPPRHYSHIAFDGNEGECKNSQLRRRMLDYITKYLMG